MQVTSTSFKDGGVILLDELLDEYEDEKTYKVVRMYFNAGREVIATGLTLEEEQNHD